MNYKNELKLLKEENKALKEEIRILSRDPLTGSFVRRYLDQLIKEEYIPKLKTRENWFYNVYLLDLNDLHDVNRKHGYETGDKYIKDSIDYVRSILDSNDISYRIFRIGGDEFLIITQPYDYISCDLLQHNNYVIVHKEWTRNTTMVLSNRNKHSISRFCSRSGRIN